MRIISKKKLRDYWESNVQAELPLIEWYFKMKNTKAANISELRKCFNGADPVCGYTVFNSAAISPRLAAWVPWLGKFENRRFSSILSIWRIKDLTTVYM